MIHEAEALPFGALLKCHVDSPCVYWVRINFPQTRVVLIAKERKIQSLVAAHFLAVTALDIGGKIVAVIFILTEHPSNIKSPCRFISS